MIPAYIAILRPAQWLKNLMLYFPPFLGGQFVQPGLFTLGVLPFCSFCLVSSAGYVFNDISDREQDISHPKKHRRPIPSGKVSIPAATMVAVLTLFAGISIGAVVSPHFVGFILIYLLISLLYSYKLKSFPVIDLFCVAAGFLIRLEAGGAVFTVTISPWLFLTVFLLAIVLSTGKRLGETISLGSHAGEHRKSLARYPAGFLDGTIYMTSGAVVVTYAMYALNKQRLLYTIPLCLFGLLRYIFRIKAGDGGDPTESLLNDPVLFAVGLLWAVMVAWSIYS